MGINEIPSNHIITMTNAAHDIFVKYGCKPTCHCCNDPIEVGDKYKLATVAIDTLKKAKEVEDASTLVDLHIFSSDKPHEVMLCYSENCTPVQMVKNAIEYSIEKHGSIYEKIDDAINNIIPDISEHRYPIRQGGCSIIDGKIVP